MKFREFETKLLAEVQHFLINWAENARATPEDYPMEMGEADWIEQFVMQLEG